MLKIIGDSIYFLCNNGLFYTTKRAQVFVFYQFISKNMLIYEYVFIPVVVGWT